MTGYIIGLEEVEAKLHRQRRLFLMRWNPNISIYKRFHFESDFNRFLHRENMEDMDWTIREWRNAERLDLYMMAQVGTNNDGIIYGGYLESEPYQYKDENGHIGRTRFVQISPLFMQRIESKHIITATYLEQRVPEIDWHGGHSGVEIPIDIAEKLTLAVCEELFRSAEDENLIFNYYEQKQYTICTLLSLLCPELKKKLIKENRIKKDSVINCDDILDCAIYYDKNDVQEGVKLEDIVVVERATSQRI